LAEGSPESRPFARRKANQLALRNPTLTPRCGRPAGPVAKLAGQKAAVVGQRDRTTPGEPSSLSGSEGIERRRVWPGLAKTNLKPTPFRCAEIQERLYAWLLVYLTTYKAWKDSKTDIHQSYWNTFQRRIEVEMLGIKNYGHVDSRVISTPEGGKALAHFSSNYWAKMDELANVLSLKGVDGLVKRLLDEMNSSSELEEAFIAFFNSLSRDAERSLVKMIADLA
jgi:hypothetical protein